ncbi:protein of unknown function [Candidatus Filomicrobium marinum]|uniref:Transposase n=1 Tax=Candidatus Filomicrobium marinum TaxID=1608628 RepID=A0A0D6JFB4_9HYPH|nr:protein of unknown function [Candidatus Filomicrobium marinum]CPR19116.1 protein of unknown function [Candidatus Filomicrobium marinum]
MTARAEKNSTSKLRAMGHRQSLVRNARMAQEWCGSAEHFHRYLFLAMSSALQISKRLRTELQQHLLQTKNSFSNLLTPDLLLMIIISKRNNRR